MALLMGGEGLDGRLFPHPHHIGKPCPGSAGLKHLEHLVSLKIIIDLFTRNYLLPTKLILSVPKLLGGSDSDNKTNLSSNELKLDLPTGTKLDKNSKRLSCELIRI